MALTALSLWPRVEAAVQLERWRARVRRMWVLVARVFLWQLQWDLEVWAVPSVPAGRSGSASTSCWRLLASTGWWAWVASSEKFGLSALLAVPLGADAATVAVWLGWLPPAREATRGEEGF